MHVDDICLSPFETKSVLNSFVSYNDVDMTLNSTEVGQFIRFSCAKSNCALFGTNSILSRYIHPPTHTYSIFHLFPCLLFPMTSTIPSFAESSRQLNGGTAKNLNPIAAPRPLGHDGCPLCDVSVYSYCTNKMFHDACCCNAGKMRRFDGKVNSIEKMNDFPLLWQI